VKEQLKRGLEILGVVAPIVCLVHCLATPVLLTALPFVSANAGLGPDDSWFHWAIVGTCAVAILPAVFGHKKLIVAALFILGASLVIVPLYVPALEATVPNIATAVAASVFLVTANLLNRKYSRELTGATACCAHPHQNQHSEV
jgi:hypothetical protein